MWQVGKPVKHVVSVIEYERKREKKLTGPK
jgi:hypothetical protein